MQHITASHGHVKAPLSESMGFAPRRPLHSAIIQSARFPCFALSQSFGGLIVKKSDISRKNSGFGRTRDSGHLVSEVDVPTCKRQRF